MTEYKATFYEWHGQAASGNTIDGLTALLNAFASEGWTFSDVKPVNVGYLVIFERPAAGATSTVSLSAAEQFPSVL